jgi:peptidoglycan/LPS O-acetylase OafA/YrhL
MLTVAAFSTKQWDPYVQFNELENTLHSVSASVMGFFYGIGVLLVILAEKSVSRAMKILGWVAVLTSIAMPILSGVVPEFGGVFQRLMFAIAITWFIVQVVRVRKDSRS